nr:hypothetical protein CFP56_24492 [Quercus suber]
MKYWLLGEVSVGIRLSGYTAATAAAVARRWLVAKRASCRGRPALCTSAKRRRPGLRLTCDMAPVQRDRCLFLCTLLPPILCTAGTDGGAGRDSPYHHPLFAPHPESCCGVRDRLATLSVTRKHRLAGASPLNRRTAKRALETFR